MNTPERDLILKYIAGFRRHLRRSSKKQSNAEFVQSYKITDIAYRELAKAIKMGKHIE
jgi:hypothetical protein